MDAKNTRKEIRLHSIVMSFSSVWLIRINEPRLTSRNCSHVHPPSLNDSHQEWISSYTTRHEVNEQDIYFFSTIFISGGNGRRWETKSETSLTLLHHFPNCLWAHVRAKIGNRNFTFIFWVETSVCKHRHLFSSIPDLSSLLLCTKQQQQNKKQGILETIKSCRPILWSTSSPFLPYIIAYFWYSLKPLHHDNGILSCIKSCESELKI